jgi:hypothetical protein
VARTVHFCSPLYFLTLQTGFLALSDTNVQPGQSAIEEVPTIALHQRLFPGDSEAILVKLTDSKSSKSDWDTNWYTTFSGNVLCSNSICTRFRNDPQRAAWQQSKLATKNPSAECHLRLLGLDYDVRRGNSAKPCVRHLDLSNPN